MGILKEGIEKLKNDIKNGISYKNNFKYNKALNKFKHLIIDILKRITNAKLYMKKYPLSAKIHLKKLYQLKLIPLYHTGEIFYMTGKIDLSFRLFEKILGISSKINDKKVRLLTLNNIAVIHQNKGNFKSSLKLLEKCLELSKKCGDEKTEAATYNNMAALYKATGNLYKSLEYYEKSIVLKTKVNDLKGQGVTFNNIALIYEKIGEYVKALRYYKCSIEISAQLNHVEVIGRTINNIASLYMKLEEKDKCLEYYEKSLLIARKTKDKRLEGSILNNLGYVYETHEDIKMREKSLKMYFQALKISKEIECKDFEAITLNNIGLNYLHLGKEDISLPYLNKSLEMFQKLNDKWGQSIGFFNFSKSIKGDNEINLETFSCFLKSLFSYVHLMIKIKRKLGKWGDVIKNIDFTKSISLYLNNISKNKGNEGLSYKILLDYYDNWNFPKGVYCLHYFYFCDELTRIITHNEKIIYADDIKIEEKKMQNWISNFNLKNSKAIYDNILKGLEIYLKKDACLLIIPHGELFLIPFNVLLNSKTNRYFIEDYSLIITYSLRMFEMNNNICKKSLLRNKEIDGLIVCDEINNKWHENLNNSNEGIEISKCFKNTTVLLNRKIARKYTILETIKTTIPKFIYFGLGGNSFAQKSTIEPKEKPKENSNPIDHIKNSNMHNSTGMICLSNNDNLFSSDIENLNLTGTKFVFLNCCSTGDGNVSKEGVLGLISSFFRSGVPTVIACVNDANDKIATKIGIGFFKYYTSKRYSKTDSLRNIILDLLKETILIDGKNIKVRDYPKYLGYSIYGYDKLNDFYK